MAAPGVDENVSTTPAPVRDPSRIPRLLGLTGSLLMAVGALGAGALPVPNPLFGLRLIGLPSRTVTVAMALTWAGLLVVLFAWLWIAKMLRWHGAVDPAPRTGALFRTALLWAIPLAVAPPLFSRDIYSYIAQSAQFARDLDPYHLGPGQAFGVDDPLVRSIPTIWRDTGAPYGPFFLLLGRGVGAVTGDDIVAGIFGHRVLALCGVALVVWALPHLARRCGVDVGLAMWLGVANPLVLFHLISGIHNESVMLGLLLAGFEIGLRAGDRWWDARFLWGGLLLVLASAVKLPAFLALGFMGIEWARRRGGRVRDVAVAAGVLTTIAVIVYAIFGIGMGVGLAWLAALDAPSLIRTLLSLPTAVGQAAGLVGVLGGLGDHTDAVLDITRTGGIALAGLIGLVLMFLVLRGKVDGITGMGAGMGAVVLLSPVVHPWYLLWAVIPLAATRAMPVLRRFILAVSCVMAVVVPPTGGDFYFRAYQLPLAVTAGIVIMAVMLLATRRYLVGRTGIEIDVLPGRLGAGVEPGVEPGVSDAPSQAVTGRDTSDPGSFDRPSKPDS